MLKKKLDRMVCDPSASAVAETITIRIVGDEGSSAPKLVESHVARAHTEPPLPASSSSAPSARPTSSVTTRKTRFSRGSCGSRPSLIAKIFVNRAKRIVWNPMMTAVAA
jgi:hypothetical protein